MLAGSHKKLKADSVEIFKEGLTWPNLEMFDLDWHVDQG